MRLSKYWRGAESHHIYSRAQQIFKKQTDIYKLTSLLPEIPVTTKAEHEKDKSLVVQARRNLTPLKKSWDS